MKPIENTENFVRRGKANVTTDPRMDRRVLDDSLAAMDEAVGVGRSSVARMILRSRTAKLAAAAAVIIALGLLVIQSNPPEQTHAPTGNIAKSPTEMLSAMSLSMAYRQGGMEAVDRQCRTAMEMLGPRPKEMTIETMLAEFNGT